MTTRAKKTLGFLGAALCVLAAIVSFEFGQNLLTFTCGIAAVCCCAPFNEEGGDR